jgi:pyruvate/2-oxoglutarate/acetoin dehydrogenase E1 component/TPP-dependent pyruvate/acetoin dehydrogenase alpha subunit
LLRRPARNALLLALDVTIELHPDDILHDYHLGWLSRHASLIGRKEVLTGKAKFGIFGDGKEVPQLAMARAFRPGDVRSGYYRDQTFMFAAGLLTVEQWFSQLYADPSAENEPASAGRQMNCHFANATVDAAGAFKKLADLKWSAADTSPTGSQMPRLVGLGYASRLYREIPGLQQDGDSFKPSDFSRGGNEIAFGTIGNASCAEGMFWEAVNAIGVLGGPVVLSIWDDEYGISVSNEFQLAKGDLSALLEGFRVNESGAGFNLYRVKGWDYPALIAAYADATERARRDHVPAILHVVELTQPQGHSTSGSHERYKSAERLEWERRNDGLVHLRNYLLQSGLADEHRLAEIETRALEEARAAQRRAWQLYLEPIQREHDEAAKAIESAAVSLKGAGDPNAESLAEIAARLRKTPSPLRRHTAVALHEALVAARGAAADVLLPLARRRRDIDAENRRFYAAGLHCEGAGSALSVPVVAAEYAGDEVPQVNGFELLGANFDAALSRLPHLVAFGEDVGKLGDVNQGFLGLQEKHGVLRVADTGIRECTILGQAIGMAMRGLRPIAEIQYLDYLPFALEIISDDLATLRWRSAGTQKAPVIVRTRGHRLEGVWHSGSPMGSILNAVRGVYFCVPRDMTRAAGMYNTLLRSDDSAIVVEVLNGYRSKERLPSNLFDFTVPLGVPEVLREGADLTLLTYGACCKLALQAADRLVEVGIHVEVIDAATLLPFDRPGIVGASVRKTHRILVVDEDVPGGASAYLLQQVLEHQHGYAWLDGPPRTLSAAEHRPPYGSDGDYWSKPNVEEIFDAAYELMHESAPARFPLFFRAHV